MSKISGQKKFILGLFLFGVVLFFYYYDGIVKPINATMMAFSYRYGFISRGAVGTAFRWFAGIVPGNMLNYKGVKVFAMAATLIFFFLLLLFYIRCLKCSGDRKNPALYGAMVLLTIFTVPTFCCQYNFGRFDMYLILFTMAALLCLLAERMEFMVVPIGAVCVMIHQGYVFMYLNVILAILFYRWMSYDGKRARKYMLLFLSVFLVSSALFLYFEFFSHANGESIYEDVAATATQLCKGGKYHQDVIDHEILGIDLSAREWKYHLMNFAQLPVFVILTLPYILCGIRFFGGMIRNASHGKDKWKYLALAAGGLTLLPNFILKIDYGRWMFALIFYYAVVTIWLLATGDDHAAGQMEGLVLSIQEKPAGILLLAYPLILTPFWDVAINRICSVFAGIPNDLWWHIW